MYKYPFAVDREFVISLKRGDESQVKCLVNDSPRPANGSEAVTKRPLRQTEKLQLRHDNRTTQPADH